MVGIVLFYGAWYEMKMKECQMHIAMIDLELAKRKIKGGTTGTVE